MIASPPIMFSGMRSNVPAMITMATRMTGTASGTPPSLAPADLHLRFPLIEVNRGRCRHREPTASRLAQ
jgi:hypothetical protein